MKAFIYKLHFTAPLQVNSDPLSLEKSEVMIHSDTLFSAIANSYAALFEADEGFFKDPPFLISSAFPFYKNTLFIKTIPVKWNIDSESREKFRKKIKKTEFIPIEMLKKVISQEKITINENSFKQEFFQEDIDGPIYTVSERPHSSVSNSTGETHIFYTSSVSFSKDAGLYFLVQFKDEAEKKRFDAAMYLLSDTGIGGKRSSGHGMFKTEEGGTFQWSYKEGEDYFINISLYHPTEREIKNGLLQNARFVTINRQNWVFSNGVARPVRSKSVRMFAEGSILKNTEGAEGDIPDVTPEIPQEIGRITHRIYRYGKLFKLPVPAPTDGGEK